MNNRQKTMMVQLRKLMVQLRKYISHANQSSMHFHSCFSMFSWILHFSFFRNTYCFRLPSRVTKRRRVCDLSNPGTENCRASLNPFWMAWKIYTQNQGKTHCSSYSSRCTENLPNVNNNVTRKIPHEQKWFFCINRKSWSCCFDCFLNQEGFVFF